MARACAVAVASAVVVLACAIALWRTDAPEAAPARPYSGVLYDPR